MNGFTREQLRAIGRRDGSLLVTAGAGTGKTSVLVERFVRAVLDDGVAADAILAITFTEKAAAQLRDRIRRRFRELGAGAQARDAEGAWISTVHGFCARVLRTHPLAAGVDPDFRVLDALEAERVGIDAFDRALEEYLDGGGEASRVEMVAAYNPDRLRRMVRTVWSHRRSRGERRPALEPIAAPAPAGEREAYAGALATALRELAGAGACGARVEQALAGLEACRGWLEGLDPVAVVEPEELDERRVGRGAGALRTPAFEALERARLDWLEQLKAGKNALHHAMLRELLGRYGEHYERRKRARSGLDFEDLELAARDLLRDEPGVRASYGDRFAHVMVDEFQDTNRLQSELLELLERDNLFRVGDEHQSIYAFRNADLGVFREHAAAAGASGRQERLTVNFRSRGELLDAVDMAFGSLWGEAHEPLREPRGARAEPPRSSPCVELLLVDKSKERWEARFDGEEAPFGQGFGATPPWRAAEARALAARARELLDAGWSRRELVLLLRSTASMDLYERALEDRGIRTYVVGGRGYWGQQQVADLRAYLAALANPLDGLALFSVIASPLVDASLDAVALLGLHAREGRRDPWRVLREELGEGARGGAAAPGANGTGGGLAGTLKDDDRRKLAAFVERFAAERELAPRVSLETLIDRAITTSGYDVRMLAMPGGERRLANVRKLMRMAREFEADEGRDLRAFIDFVSERDLIEEREGEAPLDAEDVDALRIMTVHRAKGLEFPVVLLGDLGKQGNEDRGPLRLSEDGGVGLRLASLGGGGARTAELERIERERRALDEAEERRVFYVAATRARELLVLSGATDAERWPEPAELQEPMRWIWRAFAPGLRGLDGFGGIVAGEWEGRPVPVRCSVVRPEGVDDALPAAERAPPRPEQHADGEAGTLFPPETGAQSAPRALPVSRLSYSGLADYERCGYRFYLERALGLPAPREPPVEPGGDRLDARLQGTVVHELLERLSFKRPVVPSQAEVRAALERHGARAAEADAGRLRALIEGFAGSALRERLARARRARTELPFAFPLEPPGAGGRSLLVNGVVDVHADEGDGVLVVDYKSDRLEGRDPAALGEAEYGVQRLVYALAALRSGARRVEVVHVFLERPDAPASAACEAGDAARLEAELVRVAGGIVAGRFEPAERPHRGLCAGCPGRAALCRWGPERTLAEL